MEVARQNFTETVLPSVRDALEKCHFYAFDCEFTGLALSGARNAYLDSFQERYDKTASAARAFQITQFGLAAFRWEAGRYEASCFTFHIFPGFDRRFMCQTSSLTFLAGEGFDFNKWVGEGIRYLPQSDVEKRLAALEQPKSFEPIQIVKAEDMAFVDDLVAQVSRWLKGNEQELHLDTVNPYLRAIQYQTLEKDLFGAAEPPGFVVLRETDDNGRAALTLKKVTAEEHAAFALSQTQQREADIKAAAGFSQVFQLLRECGRPAVGHNPSFDLAYCLESFVGPLPPTWQEYKLAVQRQFPGGVYDTKQLAKQLPQLAGESSSLQDLYDGLIGGRLHGLVQDMLVEQVGAAAPNYALPVVELAPASQRFAGSTRYFHDAGYDAYMTGACFAALVRLNEALAVGPGQSPSLGPPEGLALTPDKLRSLSARHIVAAVDQYDHPSPASKAPDLRVVRESKGRLSMSSTDLPYAALWEEDPKPDRSHVFWVEGLPVGTRAPGVLQMLDPLMLGHCRLHLQPAGTRALLEFSDRPRDFKEMLESLAKALAPAKVATYEEYHAMQASRFSDSREGYEDEAGEPGRARPGSHKRRRVEDGPEPQPTESLRKKKESHQSICAIM